MSETIELEDWPQVTEENLADLAHFYREGRAFKKLPGIAEMSEGECNQIAKALSGAASEISRLTARIATLMEGIDLAIRQNECEMLLTGDEIRALRKILLERP